MQLVSDQEDYSERGGGGVVIINFDILTVLRDFDGHFGWCHQSLKLLWIHWMPGSTVPDDVLKP